MKLIKTNKKGEAAEKSQRELTGLILSLLIVIVVVALIFKLIVMFSPKEDPTARAFYNRLIESTESLEPNSSTVVFLIGATEKKIKDEDGWWGVAVFPEHFSSSDGLDCMYLDSNYDNEQTRLTRNEDVSFSGDAFKKYACLFFANENYKITFAKCNPISTKLEVNDEACFLLRAKEPKTIKTMKVYLNSDEKRLTFGLSSNLAQVGLTRDVIDLFDEIWSGLEIGRLNYGSSSLELNKQSLKLKELSELGDYGIAIYSKPRVNEDSPKIYFSLVKKPDNLEECFNSNQDNQLGCSYDRDFIFNYSDTKNCQLQIVKIKILEGKNFVVFAKEYNPLSCTSQDGFLKDERVDFNNQGYDNFEKSFELILLFEDTFNECSGFVLTNEKNGKNLGDFVIAR